jgi:1,3-beta-glucanosyltransferase GAS1
VYAGKNGAFAGYNVAAYFSEFGCLNIQPRPFNEVQTIFSAPMTDIWSGALAFSYFPAQSAAGQFGMVTIDGNTVTTSTDFNNLKTEYTNVTFVNSPTSGSNSYPACPTQNSTFLASTSLPPTPNENECNCVASAVACQFKPPTNNATTLSAIVGNLIDTGCSLLGGVGGSCDAIAGDGAKGQYGAVSPCSPSKSFVDLSQSPLKLIV